MARKISRKGLVRKLDKAFADYIKARDRKTNPVCQFCRKATIEVCFHYVSRYFRGTRWDAGNAVGSCAGCNMQMEVDPYRFIGYFQRTRGTKAWDDLQRLAHSSIKFSDDDMLRMCEDYRLKLEDLYKSATSPLVSRL